MAIAAEALLRLKAVLDDEGFRKAEGALRGLDNQAKRTGGTIGGRLNKPLQAAADGMEAVGRQARRAAVGGIVATGAGLTYAAVQASNFQDSLSDIKKALGLKVSSPQFAQLSDDFLKLSRNIPVAASDLAELGGMAALAGKDSRQEILKFASDAAKLGVAFRMPGREAAESLLAIQAQLGTTDQATLDLMGTVNRLSDVFPGKVDARDILKGFQSGLGGAGKMAGMTGEQTAGFYSAFLAAGTPADAAATAMKNFLNSLTSGTSLSKEKQSALGELYGMPVDPARKQLQDELRQVNDDLVEFGGNARADAIEKLIEEARFQGKKLIEFEGQTLNLTQAGIIKKRLNEGSSEITKGLKARKKAIEAELKNMPTAGGMVAADLAKRMQADPVGTIMDVLKRIKQLPKDRQVGVVNDIFGKESQLGIAAILSNIGLVQQGFNVAAQATQNADSWLKEYNSQLENTSSQFQLLKNAFNEMAIRIGTAMLPVLTQAMKDLTPTIIELIPPMVELVKAALPLLVSGLKAAVPYLQQFAAWAKANPEKLRAIAANTVKFGAGLIALGVAAGALRNVGTVLGVLFGLGGKIKGLADLPRTIAGTLGAVGPLLQKLKGLGTGGGMFAGIISAAKGLAGRVMGPIRSLVGMIRIAFAGLTFRELFPGLANRLQQLKGTVARIFGKGAAQGAIGGAANNIRPTVLRPMNNIRPFTRIPPIANPLPWVGNVATALRGILPVLALVGRTLLGVFTGPVGWVTLLIGAGVALFTFRNQIGQFATWVGQRLGAAWAQIGPGFTAAMQSFVAQIGQTGFPLITAIVNGFAGLGPRLAPIWAQISNLFRTYVVTPIQQVWNFLVVYIGQTIAAYAITWWQGISTNFQTNVVTPIQTMWTNFVTWIGTTVAGIQGRLSGIWVGISTLFNQHVSAPIAQFWNWLVGTITQGAANLRNTLAGWWSGISARFQAEVVTPIQQLWSSFTGWLTERTAGVRNGMGGMWNGLAQGFQQHIVTPVQNLWNSLVQGMQSKWTDTVNFFQNAWNYVATGISVRVVAPIRNLFTGLADNIRSVFDNLLGWARNLGNSIIDRVNPVRQAAGFQPLQRFAKGGYVNGPTLGLIGEGRDPREYIIPERSMLGASMNYLNGKRGASVLSGVPRFAKGGYVKGGNKPRNVTIGRAGEPIQFAGKGASVNIGGRTVSLDNPAQANKFFEEIARQSNLEAESISAKASGMSLKRYRKDQQDKARWDQMLGAGSARWNKMLSANNMTGGTRFAVGAASPFASTNSRRAASSQFVMGPSIARGSAASVSNMLGNQMIDKLMARPKMFLEDQTNAKQAYVEPPIPVTAWIEIHRQRYRRPNPYAGLSQDEVNRLKQKKRDELIDSISKQYKRVDRDTFKRVYYYAKGGYVNGPTLGLIGEAGDNEYVIPERRMAASAMAFLSGARGMDVINPPRFANGGVVGSSVSNRSGSLNALLERTGAIGGQTVVVQEPTINATIQVQTGDVLQFEGQQYVTFSDYQRGLKQVQSETLGLLRTAQGRRATGR